MNEQGRDSDNNHSLDPVRVAYLPPARYGGRTQYVQDVDEVHPGEYVEHNPTITGRVPPDIGCALIFIVLVMACAMIACATAYRVYIYGGA